MTQNGVIIIEDSLRQIGNLGRRYVLDGVGQPDDIQEYMDELNVGCNVYNDRYGGVLVYRCQLASIGIPIIRIMRSQERLIFFMEIPIYGGTVFILRGCPCLSSIKPGQFESCINVQLGIAVLSTHDNLIKWKHFPHKCQWRGALMFSLICVWINDWVNNRESGNLRRYRAHYDVIVMCVMFPKHHAVDSTAIPSWS